MNLVLFYAWEVMQESGSQKPFHSFAPQLSRTSILFFSIRCCSWVIQWLKICSGQPSVSILSSSGSPSGVAVVAFDDLLPFVSLSHATSFHPLDHWPAAQGGERTGPRAHPDILAAAASSVIPGSPASVGTARSQWQRAWPLACRALPPAVAFTCSSI